MTLQGEHIHAPPVAIVVLNYNGAGVLPKLLGSLSTIDYPNLRILIVDNASTDDSLEVLESLSALLNFELIVNPTNLFFSEGNNIGIRKALQDGAEFVFLLNNDTIVPRRLITSLVDFMTKHPKAGITGPLIHFEYPPHTIWSAGGKVSTWFGLVRHRGIRQKDKGQFNRPLKVDYVSGAAMMVRRDVFEKVGLLDPAFTMYYEDTDFCFRARKAGFECWYVPTDPLIHLVSWSAGGQLSRLKIAMRARSGIKFFSRYSRWYQFPTIILGQIYEACRVASLVATSKITFRR